MLIVDKKVEEIVNLSHTYPGLFSCVLSKGEYDSELLIDWLVQNINYRLAKYNLHIFDIQYIKDLDCMICFINKLI